jgi:hypothetical protein
MAMRIRRWQRRVDRDLTQAGGARLVAEQQAVNDEVDCRAHERSSFFRRRTGRVKPRD